MPKTIISPFARQDVLDIWEFIARTIPVPPTDSMTQWNMILLGELLRSQKCFRCRDDQYRLGNM